jgi:rSAM/selenodomain-associated transferase 1
MLQTSPRASARLIIFVKAPRVGEVKTRLARDLGPEAAALAYGQMVETLCRNLGGLAEVELQFTPANAFAEVQQWARSNWLIHPQAPGDLGRRLEVAFEGAFRRGASRVVIIGSDCPAIIPADIHAAWAALRDYDLVLGPAQDGGYWLIGLRRNEPSLFRWMRWSTGAVCRETIQRARRAGLRLKLLRTLSDVDTGKDWERLKAKS